MRLRRHVTPELAAYIDRQLAPHRLDVEAHLAGCVACRHELDQIRFTDRLLKQTAVVAAPDSVWASIEQAVDSPRVHSAPSLERLWHRPSLRWARAIALLVAVAAAGHWFSRDRATWEVLAPGATGSAQMAVGSWIETAGSSRARITVGAIGTVDVEPNSRVRLGSTAADGHRLALERGTISVAIMAPPRLFFVDTPTTTVVDLGCAYTMHVADNGASQLRVTSGWASFESHGRESLVPAGARAHTRPGMAPGTPFFEDASLELRSALEALDFAGGGAASLDAVLASARVRDTLTLWHLLSRVDVQDRERVFDRIAGLAPPPATVSRDRILSLDRAMLTYWRTELAWTW